MGSGKVAPAPLIWTEPAGSGVAPAGPAVGVISFSTIWVWITVAGVGPAPPHAASKKLIAMIANMDVRKKLVISISPYFFIRCHLISQALRTKEGLVNNMLRVQGIGYKKNCPPSVKRRAISRRRGLLNRGYESRNETISLKQGR